MLAHDARERRRDARPARAAASWPRPISLTTWWARACRSARRTRSSGGSFSRASVRAGPCRTSPPRSSLPMRRVRRRRARGGRHRQGRRAPHHGGRTGHSAVTTQLAETSDALAADDAWLESVPGLDDTSRPTALPWGHAILRRHHPPTAARRADRSRVLRSVAGTGGSRPARRGAREHVQAASRPAAGSSRSKRIWAATTRDRTLRPAASPTATR